MSRDMNCAFHVLTAFWASLAMPALLPAEDRAESYVPPRLQQKTPYEPSGLALASPYVTAVRSRSSSCTGCGPARHRGAR